MSVTLIDSFASGQPDGNGHYVNKIFTIFQVNMNNEPQVSNVTNTNVGAIDFRFVSRQVRQVFNGRWYLFVRHDRLSPLADDREIVTGGFTLADFTISITIDNHIPMTTPVEISEAPVHIIPC
jgi:hypothetical protein